MKNPLSWCTRTSRCMWTLIGLETCLLEWTRQVWSWEEASRSVSQWQARIRSRLRQIVYPVSISTCSSIQRCWWLPHVHTWITWTMVFHSSVKSCKNVGTRELGSRVQCNEFGDETNQRLVEPGMSAKRVDTSMRFVWLLCGCTKEADANQVRVINVGNLGLWTWWQIGNQTVPVFSETRSVAQEWILRFRWELPEIGIDYVTKKMCWRRVPWKSEFWPETVECCSYVDLSAEDTQVWCCARPGTCLGGGTRCCARPVASVEEGHEWETSRFRGGRTWVLNVSRTSTEQWISRLCKEMVVAILWRAAYVCVPEACNVRIVIGDFEKEVGIDVWNPGWAQRDEFRWMSSKRWVQMYECCTAKFESAGTSARTWMFKIRMTSLSRNAWRAVWDGMLGKPLCQNVCQAVWQSAVCAWRQNAHRNMFENPWHSVYSGSYFCDVHYDAICSGGHRLLSDQRGEL